MPRAKRVDGTRGGVGIGRSPTADLLYKRDCCSDTLKDFPGKDLPILLLLEGNTMGWRWTGKRYVRCSKPVAGRPLRQTRAAFPASWMSSRISGWRSYTRILICMYVLVSDCTSVMATSILHEFLQSPWHSSLVHFGIIAIYIFSLNEITDYEKQEHSITPVHNRTLLPEASPRWVATGAPRL